MLLTSSSVSTASNWKGVEIRQATILISIYILVFFWKTLHKFKRNLFSHIINYF
jgi:hypothetical protein